MKNTMTPLFSLVAAALLPWGYDAFVVVPPAAGVSARGGRVSELQAKAPSVDEIQQREDARAALLDSGGVDKLMSMLTKLRGSDTDIGSEPAPAPAPAPAPSPKKAAPVKAVAAAPPAKAVAAPAKEVAAPVAAAATPVAPAAPAPAPPAPPAPAAKAAKAAAPAPPQQQKKQRKKRGKKAAAPAAAAADAAPKTAAKSDPGPSA